MHKIFFPLLLLLGACTSRPPSAESGAVLARLFEEAEMAPVKTYEALLARDEPAAAAFAAFLVASNKVPVVVPLRQTEELLDRAYERMYALYNEDISEVEFVPYQEIPEKVRLELRSSFASESGKAAEIALHVLWRAMRWTPDMQMPCWVLGNQVNAAFKELLDHRYRFDSRAPRLCSAALPPFVATLTTILDYPDPNAACSKKFRYNWELGPVSLVNLLSRVAPNQLLSSLPRHLPTSFERAQKILLLAVSGSPQKKQQLATLYQQMETEIEALREFLQDEWQMSATDAQSNARYFIESQVAMHFTSPTDLSKEPVVQLVMAGVPTKEALDAAIAGQAYPYPAKDALAYALGNDYPSEILEWWSELAHSYPEVFYIELDKVVHSPRALGWVLQRAPQIADGTVRQGVMPYLTYALWKGNWESVKLLLQHGAYAKGLLIYKVGLPFVGTIPYEGPLCELPLSMTALMYAAQNAPADVIIALLDAGAEPARADETGKNALDYLADNKLVSAEERASLTLLLQVE